MSLFDGRDLVTMMRETAEEAQGCLDSKLALAKEAAEKEAEYRAKKAKKMLDLTTGGLSVSLATVLADGDKAVGAAKVAWQCAVALADANDDQHLLRKKELGILADEYNRQWTAAGR